MGDFELIYPSENNKPEVYNAYMAGAKQVWEEFNNGAGVKKRISTTSAAASSSGVSQDTASSTPATQNDPPNSSTLPKTKPVQA